MSRRLRISASPPSSGRDTFWFQQVTDALNVLPNFSISSTSDGPESQITGDSGTLLFDVGSSATTFWAKRSGETTAGWVPLTFGSIGISPIAYVDLPTGSGTWATGSGTTVTIGHSLGVTSQLSIDALTGMLRADTGLVSVATGVGVKTLFDHFADVGNVGTGDDILYTDTITAGRLAVDGEKIVAQYGGTFVGDATSTQRLRAYFGGVGGTLIFDSGAIGIGVSTTFWNLYIVVVRESSSVVRCSAALTTSFATLAAYATYTRITGLTLANTQVLKVNGEAAGATAASDQIIAREGYAQWVPAA